MTPVEQWLEFFERGGYVVWIILLVSSVMWMLIVERYWFVLFGAGKRHAQFVNQWRNITADTPAAREWMRQGMLMEFQAQMRRSLPTILTMTAVLPLLGLFGTVTGMIKTFDALTLFGSGNPRGLAAGISEALLTTLAGLVTALSGIYFSSSLEGRIVAAQHRLEADLSSTEESDEVDDNE
ncbi:MAG: MotA/TolQ/ExbB proton channel family protein [Gammaproteobacteria bacterium]|jgi:biopolymer transport protein ExbB|nr:MotA/TolQ/ExbB proton channel family protein [Gammaproteobacteria bacterium]